MTSLDRLAGGASKHIPVKGRGQILVVVALSMIGLLITAGIATDVGILLMRKAQFDRAVDAAALAGAPIVNTSLTSANDRGIEILSANGITPASPDTNICPANGAPMTTGDYCGRQEPGTLPGATRYVVQAKWSVPLAFMQLAKFYSITLTATAKAEYFNTVDSFTSASDQGLVQSSNLELFGPNTCTGYGDQYTPLFDGGGPNGWYGELNGAYTYRIAVPPTYTLDNVRVELLDPQTGNSSATPSKVYKTDGSLVSPNPTCATNDQFNPCIIPITGENLYTGNPFWWVRMDEVRGNCTTPGGGTAYNTVWQNNTRTLFRLYYYRQLANGALDPVDLAYYIGKSDYTGQTQLSLAYDTSRYSAGNYSPSYTVAQAAAEAVSTELKWISPGAAAADLMPAFAVGTAAPVANGISLPYASAIEPTTMVENCDLIRRTLSTSQNNKVSLAPKCSGDGNFTVSLSNEAPDIYVDPNTGVRHLYLDVRGLDGSSENNWEVWAGPTISEGPADANRAAPSDINSRQLYILREKSAGFAVHSSQGVVVYGVGHLPMNSDADPNNPQHVRFPLAYLGPEFAGLPMNITLFDADSGTQAPLIFYFDTIPQDTWEACFTRNQTTYPCTTDQGGKNSNGYVATETMGISDVATTYSFTIPSDGSGVPFYGGRLFAYYQGGNTDTFGWKLTVNARPTLVN